MAAAASCSNILTPIFENGGSSTNSSNNCISSSSPSNITCTSTQAFTSSTASISTSSSISETNQEIFSKDIHHNDDTLTNTMFDMFENISQTDRTFVLKLRLRDTLYYSISQAYFNSGLYVVGSSLNGFGKESSDMDLCLVLTNGELDQRTVAIDILHNVQQILSTLSFVKEQILIPAKVPILRIKFHAPYSEMVVDLNCNNSVAVRNTHLLFYYAFFDWRIRPLVTVIKEWAKQNDINDSTRSTFTSYSLVIMALHYLQVMEDPVLPSLQQIYPKRFHPKCDIRNLNFSQPLEEISPQNTFKRSNTSSLGTLLIGFFHYYAHEYNYDTNAISIRLGRKAQRAEVLRGSTTRQWAPLLIEEPFNRSNTAHSIYDEMIFKSVKQKFQDAHRILSTTMDLNNLITVLPPLTPSIYEYEEKNDSLPQIYPQPYQCYC